MSVIASRRVRRRKADVFHGAAIRKTVMSSARAMLLASLAGRRH